MLMFLVPTNRSYSFYKYKVSFIVSQHYTLRVGEIVENFMEEEGMEEEGWCKKQENWSRSKSYAWRYKLFG